MHGDESFLQALALVLVACIIGVTICLVGVMFDSVSGFGDSLIGKLLML